ncbi:DUF2971 domain-containing protein [Leptospira noguchii]|uniref:DUF2971 domain-containing protein n=1 Tax=Leptospira noguchii TaxID=28182 RepID=A0A9Q8RNK1_9LEPT|nr:DUF2971 domain-containing protein [Leptospira noguchii]TQE76544.1 DUF2971 domain-containing protein [Leptospira noguchii]UOG31084.1 DUF2971 domain-containing protein [Leptospira noguchii]UOG53235.1 DUF2971 domain-containing protein [Leptospira noguchii]UOG57197.1 DUF2971 domain-containing protein [Leptospira noguchii]
MKQQRYMLNSNWIYRYREFNTVSLKELLYEEIYFSSQDELNDPLDYEFVLTIKKGQAHIHKFFVEPAFIHYQVALQNAKDKIFNEIIEYLSSQLLILNEIEDHIPIEFLDTIFNNNNINYLIGRNIRNLIINSYRNIFPVNLRSVSFSKTCENPLLWTHYAGAHTGFCLIFNPEKKKLNLRKIGEEKFEQFSCHNVKYGSDIEIDISLMFNDKNEFSDSHVFKKFLIEVQQKGLLTKHASHSKEKEIRIFGNYGTSYSIEPRHEPKIIKTNKIHYFDPGQFMGIVFGYRMKEIHKEEILTILNLNTKYKNYYIFQSVKRLNTVRAIFTTKTARF